MRDSAKALEKLISFKNEALKHVWKWINLNLPLKTK